MNKFNAISEELQNKGCIVKRKEDLKKHVTMQVGGTAEIFALPTSVSGIAEAVEKVKSHGMPFFIMGNGSNVIFEDAHFEGVIFALTEIDKISGEGNTLFAECGATLNKLSITAKNNSLTGLEFAYGIPGTVGGAVYMNAGAYGGQISDILIETTFLDLNGYGVKTISNAEHKFSYRNSIFQHENYIILSSSFRLAKGNKDDIDDKMAEFMRLRKEKQPLDFPNSGSVFKRYEGFFTAKLIEDCGLKGRTVGGAVVSPKHAGFIVNKGSATFDDVTRLIDIIKNEIYKKNGIEIECEVKIIRFGELT